MISTQFENGALRTAVVLSRYIETLRAWNADEIGDENGDGDATALRVSARHKERFAELLALFESDELLRQTQELSVVAKLANFDAQSAQIMRDLAQMDEDV